ncbi:hypothetical protein SAMN05444159_3959 [Bradyrhizobium lablabi]|uniref:Uncharacterized protein n=1 Tax=Bradyrhizobium lablabi TaxID=722472 RepID=A0A1M6ULY7_9BRAD|nr:hypothetical protein SAMN05444159_3959 [Bradyrhizobium lablabi]
MERRAVGKAASRAVEKLGAKAAPHAGTTASLTAFPKRHFPAIHRTGDDEIRAIFQSQ